MTGALELGAAGIFQELHAAVVPVRDLEASGRWYRDVLGLVPRKEVPGLLVVFGTGGDTNLCLYVPIEGERTPGDPGVGSFPNWRARDVEAVHTWLLARGVRCTPVQAGGGMKWFTFHDPDGNRFDVCEYGSTWLE